MNGVRRHTRSGGRWHTRTGYKGMVARSWQAKGSLARNDGRGLCTVRTICPTASAKGTQKANEERFHIKTGSSIPTDYNEGNVYCFSSDCAAVIAERQGRNCSSIPRGLYQEGEEVVGIHAVGIGEVHRLHDIIRISVWSTVGFGTHFLPSFPTA
ncbi:hypothetical protein M9H77_36054 [Catharanthus roseus]|uniref:Uncharacterized protein n=1 Tax=Catharanthus roseus TaxID=4058 RepID=A0ACB9ZRQ3_CATRO|nr:hypothetical protein M9H77_36054 [Catharanthus roseus]